MIIREYKASLQDFISTRDNDTQSSCTLMPQYMYYHSFSVDATIYSAKTRTMNAMALFSLYLYFIFTFFVVIFYLFPELTNHIREPKQWRRHFFFFFPCFRRCRQRLRRVA